MEAPSTFLPRLRRLDEYAAPELHAAIAKLMVLYLPEVRGTTPVDEDVEILQADSFERSFAIRWLTGFISRGAEWAESLPDDEEPEGPCVSSGIAIPNGSSFHPPTVDTHATRTLALDHATGLLAACAGTSASGALSRTFTFPTSAPSTSISITLRDESLSVGDHTAVGLQTWGSAYVLGERVAKDPSSFGFDTRSSSRILELGAGTGLLSLLAGKISILGHEQSGPGHTIIATDYHPAVMENLQTNVKSNFLDESSIVVHPLDWSLYTTGKVTTGLSRAPSTAATPVGTPRVEDKSKTFTPTPSSELESLTSALPTPSISFSSSLSPPSPQTPQTPKTPQTSRSPPPNLARAVFSRLMARGVKFDMPVEKNPKTAEPETERINVEEPGGDICGEPFGPEAGSQPNNLMVSIDCDGHEQSWIDGLGRSVSDVSVEKNLDPFHSNSTIASPLLCESSSTPCLERDGQATSPSMNRNVRQGYLDTSNKLSSDDVEATVGPTGGASIAHASLSLTASTAAQEALLGQVSDNSAGRIEVVSLNSEGIVGSGGEIGAGLKNLGIGEPRICESDIGVACKTTENRPAGLPFSPPAHMSAPPFDEPFDIIFGADIVYELSHATLVNGVVQRLLRKPAYAPHLPPAYFHLIMPLRPTHADEATSVDQTFPRAEDVCLQKDRDGEVLAIVQTETYARSAGVGRADEVQYVYYRMTWV